MTFKILYVEDEDTSKVVAAVESGKWSGPGLQVIPVKSPELLEEALADDVDLILADIGFPAKAGGDKNRLFDILAMVEEHSRSRSEEEDDQQSIPVIVYTSRTTELESLLLNRRKFYDIWDKSVATPEYVAWRLGTVAREIERARPGRVLQKAIADLTTGASWHTKVLTMLRKYDTGWSEYDQIMRCGESIDEISKVMGCEDGESMWRAVEQWELIDRSADRRVRGHARHALHVFWLGYVLLNHSAMADVWSVAWARLLEKRSNREAVKGEDAPKALNAIWFFAAVFHDVGYPAQDGANVMKEVLRVGELLDLKWGDAKTMKFGGKYIELATDVFVSMKADGGTGYQVWSSEMIEHFKGTLTRRAPDHGCVSAGRLLGSRFKNSQCEWWLREAARAAALHSAFPSVDVASRISWDSDPMGCLLLVLDQLQTWDRERPEILRDRDWPERAELVDLRIVPGSPPSVEMTIKYLVRRHVEQSKEIFKRVHEEVTKVLNRYPVSVMRDLRGKLPFTLNVKFYLSGKQIEVQ